jgi:hypothetical protein
MKGLMIVLMALVSFDTFAKTACSPEAQHEIDSLLSQVERAEDDMKRVDLEFEIKQISYNFTNCRKSSLQRDLASVDLPEMDIEVEEAQAQDESELDSVLRHK